MNTQHTPGPWKYGVADSTTAYVFEDDGTTVARLSAVENTTAHTHLYSNARLIAAAPELLEALREMTHALDVMQWKRLGSTLGKPYNKARAAITKATWGQA